MTAVATAAVAVGVGGSGAVAGAQAPPCLPGDLACELVRGLDGALAPAVQPPPSPSSSTTTGTSPATTAGGLVPDGVEAAGTDAATAELSAAPGRVPSVPVGQALELPPLTIPDFAGAGGAEAAPVARAVRPLRSEVGDSLTGLASPPVEEGAGAARAAAVAVGVPTLLVGASLVARRRAATRRPLGAPAVAEVADPT